MFGVSLLSTFMHWLREAHLRTWKRVLRCIRGQLILVFYSKSQWKWNCWARWIVIGLDLVMAWKALQVIYLHLVQVHLHGTLRSKKLWHCRSWIYCSCNHCKSSNLIEEIVDRFGPDSKPDNWDEVWQSIDCGNGQKTSFSWKNQAHKNQVSFYSRNWSRVGSLQLKRPICKYFD